MGVDVGMTVSMTQSLQRKRLTTEMLQSTDIQTPKCAYKWLLAQPFNAIFCVECILCKVDFCFHQQVFESVHCL